MALPRGSHTQRAAALAHPFVMELKLSSMEWTHSSTLMLASYMFEQALAVFGDKRVGLATPKASQHLMCAPGRRWGIEHISLTLLRVDCAWIAAHLGERMHPIDLDLGKRREPWWFIS